MKQQANLGNLTLRELSLIIVSQMHAGKSRQDMAAYLRQRGWPDASAQHFIANVLAQHTAAAHLDVEEPPPTRDSHNSNPAALLWLIALIGLALIGLGLIGNPLF